MTATRLQSFVRVAHAPPHDGVEVSVNERRARANVLLSLQHIVLDRCQPGIATVAGLKEVGEAVQVGMTRSLVGMVSESFVRHVPQALCGSFVRGDKCKRRSPERRPLEAIGGDAIQET